MRSTRSLLGLALASILPVAISAQLTPLVTVALEDRHIQTGDSTTSLAGYHFFATVEDIAGVTSATVQGSSGVLSSPTNMPDEGDYLEYEATRATLGAATTAFPLSANYTIVASGSTSGSVVINGTADAFADLVPANPVFTINGVSGTWSGSTFSFNPVGVTSFTVTINNYVTTTPGGHYAYYMEANHSLGFSDEVSAGPLTDATSFTAPTFTFTNGAAVDGGDVGNSSTYGFSAGSSFDLEAGFFNVLGLADSGLGVGQKAFVIGTTTSFTLQAIPEPSTYAAIFGALALAGAAIHRRRRAA